MDEEKRRSVLKKFDHFIEAIIERRTLAENVVLDVSQIRLTPEAVSVLDRLMGFVPPPLAEMARTKTIHAAAQMAVHPEGATPDGAVETEALVRAFWMGTPEPSRAPLRQALEQMGLWRYIASPEAV